MTALSSNHFSHDQQLDDVIGWLRHNLPASHDALLAEFPEVANAIWSGSWWDTEAMQVEADFSSWVVDWVESNTPVYWDEGEPWVADDTYQVRRFFFDDDLPTEIAATGLTLAQAKAHCNDPEASSTTATSAEAVARTERFGQWFDGYSQEHR